MKESGWHGTDANAVPSILNVGFIESTGEDQWFADGAYFFVAGVSSNPADDAKKWAIATAYDKAKKANKYTKYAVLSCKISYKSDNIWDLTTTDGLRQFNYARMTIISGLPPLKAGARRGFLDNDIINFVRKTLSFDVIRKNVYIKFRQERVERIESRVENCTILVVSNPKLYIDQKSIKIEASGDII